MSVQHLAVDRPIAVPLGQVEVELVDFAGTGAQVVVVDERGADLPSSVRLSATRLLLATPQQQARVIAYGPGGGPFPHGAALRVMVRVGQPPLRADLVGPRTDVGALAQPVLATLTPRGDTIDVTAVKVDEAATPPPDEGPLPELARRAFYVARGSTPTHGLGRRGVVVCVDTSASMRAHAGVLQCLLEIAFGIDRGLGDAGDVPAFAVTSHVRPLPPLTAANLTGYADALLGTAGSRGPARSGDPSNEASRPGFPGFPGFPSPAGSVSPARSPGPPDLRHFPHRAGARPAVPPEPVEGSTGGPESGCRAELLAEALGDLRSDRMVVLLTDEVPSGIDACAGQWAGDGAEWRVTVIADPEELLAARGLAGFGMCAVPPTLDYGELCDETLGHRALAEVIARMTSPQPVGAS